jgi:hypothetical protein
MNAQKYFRISFQLPRYSATKFDPVGIAQDQN